MNVYHSCVERLLDAVNALPIDITDIDSARLAKTARAEIAKALSDLAQAISLTNKSVCTPEGGTSAIKSHSDAVPTIGQSRLSVAPSPSQASSVNTLPPTGTQP